MKHYNNKKGWMCSMAALILASGFFTGCREEIDMANRYTQTGDKILDYLEKNSSTFSHYTDLLKVTTISKGGSPVANLVNAYPNYTCFAPTNEAINNYLDSLKASGKWASADFQVLLDSVKAGKHVGDSIAKVIVLNSLIAHGSDKAYETSDFTGVAGDNSTFSLPNMNDRYMIQYVATNDSGKNECFVEDGCRIINPNIKATNGYIQVLDKVIAPKKSTISDLFAGLKNMQIFGELLARTGWDDSLIAERDESYEELYPTLDKTIKQPSPQENVDNIYFPEHRYFGFTVFAETDDVIKKAIENTPGNTVVEKLAKYLESKYKNNTTFAGVTYGTSDEDLQKADNVINQFVAYHILPVKLASDKLVIHYNEKGRRGEDVKSQKITIPVFEYYETMRQANGPRRSLKLYESQESGGVRINRSVKMSKDYLQEVDVKHQGARILQNDADNGQTNALNGYVYPIDQLLVYSDQVAQEVLLERQRYDVASLIPELINMNWRRLKAKINVENKDKWNLYFPHQFHFSTIQSSPQTEVYYLSGLNNNYNDYQGDEIMVKGNYDITIKLPPVPVKQTYEIRYGMSMNPLRGMCQVYFGDAPDNTLPEGMPMDIRANDGASANKGGLLGLNVGWDYEAPDDESYNLSVDKSLRNNGWMKGPRYFEAQNLGYFPLETYKGTTAYHIPTLVRKVLLKKEMEPNKTYYLRLKSVLKEDAQCFMDYIEIVPQTVYGNLEQPEDQW